MAHSEACKYLKQAKHEANIGTITVMQVQGTDELVAFIERTALYSHLDPFQFDQVLIANRSSYNALGSCPIVQPLQNIYGMSNTTEYIQKCIKPVNSLHCGSQLSWVTYLNICV